MSVLQHESRKMIERGTAALAEDSNTSHILAGQCSFLGASRLYTVNTCWADVLGESTFIGLPIPGAHNAQAVGNDGMHDTQSRPISEQVARGIRFFDIDYQFGRDRTVHGSRDYAKREDLIKELNQAVSNSGCKKDVYFLHLNNLFGTYTTDKMVKRWTVDLQPLWKHGYVRIIGDCIGSESTPKMVDNWWIYKYPTFAGQLVVSIKNQIHCNAPMSPATWRHTYNTKAWKSGSEAINNDDPVEEFCKWQDSESASTHPVVIDWYKDFANDAFSWDMSCRPILMWKQCRRTSPPTVFLMDMVESTHKLWGQPVSFYAMEALTRFLQPTPAPALPRRRRRQTRRRWWR